MTDFDLIIITDDNNLNPENPSPYYQTVLLEDKLIKDALESLDLKVGRISWSDPEFDWSTTPYALFRSTWDYHHRFDEFIRWMGKTSKMTQLINTFRLSQWNLDKHYLLDLQKKGVPVVPTNFIKPLAKTTLSSEIEKMGWLNGTVLKPSISGSARHTYRLKTHNISNHESIFQRLIRMESMMIQPFMEQVIDFGEVSLIVINGKYTHGVLKKPKFGDFRIQQEFGGTVEIYEPSQKEIDIAEQAIHACPSFPVYGRVDIVRDSANTLLVSEVELIEPELFLRNNPHSADKFAKSILDYIQADG